LRSKPPRLAWRAIASRRSPPRGRFTWRGAPGYAQAAERACHLAADLQRRAEKLLGAALTGLLDDDSFRAATRIPGLSERGARRLFDRLVELGAIRELTGRASFRLYGL